jgi:DNA-binding NarL/FixJ family response regulator
MLAAMSGGVLVVDDDPVFRGLAGRTLSAAGLAVCGEAGSVASALAAAHALRPDAVLVDVGLPDGSGVDLARLLVDLPWGPRVLLTSTDPEAAGAAQVRGSGAQAFIVKDELPSASLRRLLLGA